MALLPFLVMVLTLLLGLPIAFSLAAAGIVGIYLQTGDWNVVIRILGTTPFSTVADYVLTTIPMFILMAYFSASGGLARDLYLALGDPQSGGWALRTYVKPFSNWIWLGALIMAGGGVVSLTDRRYRVGAPARRAVPAALPAE